MPPFTLTVQRQGIPSLLSWPGQVAHPVPPSEGPEQPGTADLLWLRLARKVGEQCGTGTHGSIRTGTAQEGPLFALVTFKHLRKVLLWAMQALSCCALVTALGHLMLLLTPTFT